MPFVLAQVVYAITQPPLPGCVISQTNIGIGSWYEQWGRSFMPKSSEKNSVRWHSNPHAIKKNFHQKGLFLAVQGIAWNSSDCFESFSPLNNVVPEGVITPWSNRMIFRLFKGHWMPLFEISLSINVIMCKSAMHCQSSNKSRPWPLFDEEWESSYSHHFTTA